VLTTEPPTKETTMKHAQQIGAFPPPFGPHAVQSALASVRALADSTIRALGSLTGPATKAEAQ
jgi:hypothetical protein